MTFEPKSFEQIYTDLEADTRKRLPDMSDFQVGSVIRTMYESVAYEVALLYEQMHQVYRSSYIDTAEGAQLDLLVAILGVQRGLPDFAIGEVMFERDPGNEEVTIPVGTLVITQETDKNPKRAYTTIEAKTLAPDQLRLGMKVRAVERGEDQVVPAKAITVMPLPIPSIKAVVNEEATRFTGKRSETDQELRQRAKSSLISSGKASLIAIKNALLSLPNVKEVKLIELFDQSAQPSASESSGQKQYGLVDVFVDGVDFDYPPQVQYLQAQIDRVRAAGVLVRLAAAIPVYLDAVIKIAANPDLKLSEADQRSLEQAVHAAITTTLEDMKMGQPLLVSQFIRQVLSVPNVNNLEQFELSPQAENGQKGTSYKLGDKDIPVGGGTRKFKPGHIFVALTARPVPVRMQFQGDQLSDTQKQPILNELRLYFQNLRPGDSVVRSTIQSKLQTVLGTEPRHLELTIAAPEWALSPLAKVTDTGVSVSFAEKATLDPILFAYRDLLWMVGALHYQAPTGTTSTKKQQLETTIRQSIAAYIEQLPPETEIDLNAIKQVAQAALPSLAIDLNIGDFWVLSTPPDPTRVNAKEKIIPVLPLEKARLGHFLISSDTEPMQVEITQLALKLVVPKSAPTGFQREKAITEIRQRVGEVIQQFRLPGLGQNFSATDLKTALSTPINDPRLQGLLCGVTYTVDTLVLVARSNRNRSDDTPCEDSTQTITIHQRQPEIRVRSVEQITALVPPSTITIS